jgi:hypothetical protein
MQKIIRNQDRGRERVLQAQQPVEKVSRTHQVAVGKVTVGLAGTASTA